MTLSGWAYEADGSLILTPAVPATANRGLVSIGPGPWDGASVGHFVGVSAGQLIAGCADTNFLGDFFHFYGGVNGALVARLDTYGNLYAGAFIGNSIGATNGGPSVSFAAATLFLQSNGSAQIPTTIKGAAAQTADLLQANINGGAVLSGIRADGLIYGTTSGVATKQKAGIPADTDWTVAPPNGTMVVDSTDNKLYVRVGGAWKGVAIA